MSKVIINSNSFWINKEEFDFSKKFYEKLEKEMLPNFTFIKKSKEEKYLDSIKICLVTFEGQNIMLGKSTIDNKYYKLNKSIPTVKLPIEEIKNDNYKFLRWATGFDF